MLVNISSCFNHYTDCIFISVSYFPHTDHLGERWTVFIVFSQRHMSHTSSPQCNSPNTPTLALCGDIFMSLLHPCICRLFLVKWFRCVDERALIYHMIGWTLFFSFERQFEDIWLSVYTKSTLQNGLLIFFFFPSLCVDHVASYSILSPMKVLAHSPGQWMTTSSLAQNEQIRKIKEKSGT